MSHNTVNIEIICVQLLLRFWKNKQKMQDYLLQIHKNLNTQIYVKGLRTSFT